MCWNDLSDAELGVCLLRRAWTWQDVGGVSNGRHIRNHLLEGALALIEFGDGVPPIRDPLPRISKDTPEGRLRRTVQVTVLFGKSVSLSFISDWYLAILMVLALRAWYRAYEKEHECTFLPEAHLVNESAGLLGEPNVYPDFGIEVLLQEYTRRKRRYRDRRAGVV
jgi:hypothetical protein